MSDDDLNISDDNLNEETSASLLHKLQNLMINEKLSPEPLQHQEQLVRQIQEILAEQKTKSRALSSDIHNATTVNLIDLEVQRTEYMLKTYLRTRIQKLEKFAIYRALKNENARQMPVFVVCRKGHFRRFYELFKRISHYETRLAELVEKCPELDGQNLQEEDRIDFEYITTAFTDDELDFIRESSLNDKNLLEKVVVDNVPNCDDLGLRDDLKEKLGSRFAPPDLDTYTFAEVTKAADNEEFEVQEINGNLTLVTTRKGDLFILPYRSIKEKVDKGEAVLY